MLNFSYRGMTMYYDQDRSDDSGGVRRFLTHHAAAFACMSCFIFSSTTQAVDFSNVPGTVISYQEAPDLLDRILDNEVYPASPSITVMPDGSYIASHDLFYETGDSRNHYTWIYRSADQGQTWTKQTEIDGAFWSTVFQINGELYLWGYRDGTSDPTGDILIRKSTDYGLSWTDPIDAASGLLKDGDYGGTPNTPVIYNGRIWIAQSGKRVMSASVNADLLLASSWTLSGSANTGNSPLGDDLVITESQIVASPLTGVVLLPKIGEHPNTVLLKVNSPTSIQSPGEDDWVSLPGGEKKFATQYDEVSGKFYILDNVVLPEHAGVTTAALTRTTGALLSSTDLVNWDVEKIFLFTSNIDNGIWGEAFQYFQFAVDDVDQDGVADDLAVVSRTAFAVSGETKPPRGHDSNMITFHTIEDFRTTQADFYLSISDGTVKRYEYTQNEDAPLGEFAIGSSFDGSDLTNPNALAADNNMGNVYIRETSGRILKFDLAGNFLETVSALPSHLSWAISTDIDAPGRENRAWTNESTRGNWSDPLSWFYWGRADTFKEIARFGSANATTAYADINAGETFTAKGLHFDSPNRYIIDGDGNLILNAGSSNASITILQGSHWLRVNTTLASDVDLYVADGQRFEFRDDLDLNGNTLYITGQGTVDFDQALTMDGGDICLDGLATLIFSSPTTGQLTLNGNLIFDPDDSFELIAGATFNLVEGVAYLNGETFNHLILPSLDMNLAWDTSTFYTDGIITIVAILRGDLNDDGFVGLDDLDIVLSNWNQYCTPGDLAKGDLSGNGYISLADLDIVLNNWNNSLPPTQSSNIPEPGTLLGLLSLGATTLIRRP